jgi:hypothetical protein
VFGRMSYRDWLVRVKMVVQARYLVEEAVLAVLERKGSMPQVEMGDHLLGRDGLKRFEGQVVIPAHDRAHARKVKRRGKPSRCWTAATCVSSVEWSALEELKAEATDPLV